jgi:hypothetical protein
MAALQTGRPAQDSEARSGTRPARFRTADHRRSNDNLNLKSAHLRQESLVIPKQNHATPDVLDSSEMEF